MRKKILSLLLSIAVTISMIPSAAYADGSEEAGHYWVSCSDMQDIISGETYLIAHEGRLLDCAAAGHAITGTMEKAFEKDGTAYYEDGFPETAEWVIKKGRTGFLVYNSYEKLYLNLLTGKLFSQRLNTCSIYKDGGFRISDWTGSLSCNNGFYRSGKADALEIYRLVETKRPTYTISFVTETGIMSKETDDGGRVNSIPEPVRTGYSFDGWFTAEEGGEKISEDTVFGESVSVYAHWTPWENSDFAFVLKDENGKPVPGARFTLTYAADSRAGGIQPVSAVSDENGKVYFENIYVGCRFVLCQTQAPEGYEAKGEISAELTGDELVVEGIETDASDEVVFSIKRITVETETQNRPIIPELFVTEVKAPGAVTDVTLSATKSSITVNWSKVNNADGYIVEYKKASDSKYAQIVVPGKYSKGKSIYRLDSSTKYNVRVCAYRSVGMDFKKGSYSYIKSISTKKDAPGKVSLTLVKPGKKKAALKWKRISSADGYQVTYKKKTAKSWTSVSVSSKYLSRTISKLTRNKKYQFKVRAYKYIKKSGKKVKSYGAYSTIKTVKIK